MTQEILIIQYRSSYQHRDLDNSKANKTAFFKCTGYFCFHGLIYFLKFKPPFYRYSFFLSCSHASYGKILRSFPSFPKILCTTLTHRFTSTIPMFQPNFKEGWLACDQKIHTVLKALFPPHEREIHGWKRVVQNERKVVCAL